MGAPCGVVVAGGARRRAFVCAMELNANASSPDAVPNARLTVFSLAYVGALNKNTWHKKVLITGQSRIMMDAGRMRGQRIEFMPNIQAGRAVN